MSRHFALTSVTTPPLYSKARPRIQYANISHWFPLCHMYLNPSTCTKNQPTEQISPPRVILLAFSLITQLGCWILLLKITKLFWLDLYRVMLSNFTAAHNSFADSLSHFLLQLFLPILHFSKAFTLYLTREGCFKTALLKVLFLDFSFPRFPGMNSVRALCSLSPTLYSAHLVSVNLTSIFP